MYGMFGECYALKEINLSNFNTNNVTNMSSMFYDFKKHAIHICYIISIKRRKI